jgi:hypothetical protein
MLAETHPELAEQADGWDPTTYVWMELFISRPLDPKMRIRFTTSLAAKVEPLSQCSNLSSQVSDPMIFGYPRMNNL